MNGGENIEWHVEITTYKKRGLADAGDENLFLNEILKIAIEEQVTLRFFSDKKEFAFNINTNSKGMPRTGNDIISYFNYFGHGSIKELWTQYNNDAGKLTTEDLKSGILERGAFGRQAVTISCGCNSATPDSEGESFRSAWVSYFGFELYSVRGKVDYWDQKNPSPEEGATWIPNPPPYYIEYIIHIAPITMN